MRSFLWNCWLQGSSRLCKNFWALLLCEGTEPSFSLSAFSHALCFHSLDISSSPQKCLQVDRGIWYLASWDWGVNRVVRSWGQTWRLGLWPSGPSFFIVLKDCIFRFKMLTKIAAEVFFSIVNIKKNAAANLSLDYNLHMWSYDLIMPKRCCNHYNLGRFITECMILY